MRTRLLYEFFVMILSFIVLWFFISKLSLAPKDFSFELSVAQEEKIGDMMVKVIVENMDKVESPKVDSAIMIIFNRLESGIDSSKYHYKFYVVDDDQINAFTLLGGNIVIYSGLIEFAETPEELAAVIAHEMGHVENRDVVYKIAKELGVSVVLSVLLNSDYAVISNIAKKIIGTVFDREQESAADDFALALMAKTGIKPYALASLFERLTEEKGAYNKNLEFVMSHPHNDKRINAAMEYKVPPGFEEKPFSDIDWPKIREDVD